MFGSGMGGWDRWAGKQAGIQNTPDTAQIRFAPLQ